MTDFDNRWDFFLGDFEGCWLQGGISFWTQKLSEVEKLKKDLQEQNCDQKANQAWYIETIIRIHILFLKAWDHNNAQEFTAAWVEYEQAELACYRLKANILIEEIDWVANELLRRVKNWQSLYPYGVFASPEFLVEELTCSICEQKRSPWKFCGHETGLVYKGELCSNIVSKMKILGISLVTDPVQKYSVIQPSLEDEGVNGFQRRHAIIIHAMKIIPEPFCYFRTEFKKVRWPHSKFPDLEDHDLCPCKSSRSYRNCCKNEKGVLRPHVDILVNSTEASTNIAKIIYPR